ncbi:amidohydrolase family protein [Litoreibacter roseus]|nr:amidohydrolase family protein [Litoreibacter roseus]
MIPTSQPPRPSSAPEKAAPVGAIDSHIHILAGPEEAALSHTRGENPAEGLDMDGFIARYRQQMDSLRIARAVIVHSILYGADNSVTLEAIRRLGSNAARGVGLVKDGAAETELDALAEAHIKAIRLNFVHGGVLSWDGVQALAPALADRNMHIQMLLNTDEHIVDLADDIRALPVPLVIDHIGWPDLAKGADDPGFQTLCTLMAEGHVYVKLSGLYRLASAPYEATDDFVAALVRANPERCLWGSDYPYIMLNGAKMPDAADLLNALHRVVTNADMRRRIMVETPEQLYGFDPVT